MLRVLVKLGEKFSFLPKRGKSGDAGYDLTASSVVKETIDEIWYSCNISTAIPKDHVGLVFPRSSLSKYDLILCNHVPVFDSGYRGDYQLRFRKIHRALHIASISVCMINSIINKKQCKIKDIPLKHKVYEVGDRIAQLIILPYPEVEYVPVEELPDSERGKGGFGSTGT